MAGVFVAAAPAREWECKLFQAHAELLAWRGQVGEPETAPTDTASRRASSEIHSRVRALAVGIEAVSTMASSGWLLK